MEVLVADGWEGFTLQKVCARAGVTVGMLYRRFDGREALLAALQRRWIDEAVATLDALRARRFDWPAMAPGEALRAAILAMAEGFRRDEGQTRIFGLQSGLDRDGLARLGEVARGYATWFHAAMDHHAAAVRRPDPDRAIDFAYRIVIDCLIRRATHGDGFDTGRPSGGWDAFADELRVVCAAYLFPDGGELPNNSLSR